MKISIDTLVSTKLTLINSQANSLIKNGLRKSVIVSGMHRSGTSCLMGTLENLGLNGGNNNKSSKFNLKGNREMPSIRKFHDKIWEAYDADWTNPRIINHFTTSQKQELVEIILHEFPQKSFIGIKDPRFLFFIDAWMEIFDDLDHKIICSYRHPFAVARSLNKRNGFEIKEGLDIWKKYNTQLLNSLDNYDIRLINFDEPVDLYHQHIEDFYVQEIGPLKNQKFEAFYSSDLKNFDNRTKALDSVSQNLYNKLNAAYHSQNEVGKIIQGLKDISV